jgi:hypothetical protein
MRKRFAMALLLAVMTLFAGNAAYADSIPLTGGTLQLFLGDPGSADLIGAGFHVSSTASGSFPVTASPGSLVDFSTDVSLSNWGPALVNGIQLHGDASGPGAGRLWITGTIHVAAVPFVAPPPSSFTGFFEAPVTLSGFLTGYSNTDLSQAPLFTATISGNGTAGGSYRLIGSGSSASYLDTCCSSIAITAAGPPPSPTPEPASVILIGSGAIGLACRRAWRKLRDR